MQLVTVTPHPEIAPWIHHLWVFRSPLGLPGGDLRVVVPNGRHKLIVQDRHGLTVWQLLSGMAFAAAETRL